MAAGISANKRVKVAILGASGYTALELARILVRHPGAEVVAATSRAEESTRFSQLHPSLTGQLDLDCVPFDATQIKKAGVEMAFGCLPHGASQEAVGALIAQGIRVIDLSADFRLRTPEAHKKWYKEDHHHPQLLAEAVYGLPEVYRDQIAKARLVANPGCYPQTVQLGMAPLVRNGWIEPHSIIADSKSGVSGAGRSLKLGSLFVECNESFSAYQTGIHRHTPEMEQVLGDVGTGPVKVFFSPHLVPMDRGIFSTIYAAPAKTGLTTENLRSAYREFYRDHPFVRIVDHLPATKHTMHSNFVDLHPLAFPDRVVVLAALDNLTRGASGVAVQNFNLMTAQKETAGFFY